MMSICIRCSRRIETYSTSYVCAECMEANGVQDDNQTEHSSTPYNQVEESPVRTNISAPATLTTPTFTKTRRSISDGDDAPASIKSESRIRPGATIPSFTSKFQTASSNEDLLDSERVKRRRELTADAFKFKSLSPMPSPPSSDDEEEAIGARLSLRRISDEIAHEPLATRSYSSKKFKDQVHGHIELPALCIAVMDTPQFQRLRNLKQLGAAYFVFPGASHNRFEHSLGVCWLAGALMRRLKDVQPELGITELDIQLVQLAGLVHDLGHGPYSHMFDGQFIPRTRPDLGHSYCHENMTVLLIDELIKENNLDLSEFGLHPIDITFIKECVLGEKIEGGIKARRGRPREKAFMYDVISNVHSGMDVDRLDYYERDARNTCVKSGCDVQRLIMESRVAMVHGTPRIVYPDKLVGDVLAAYQTRFRLHNAVYQHKVVKAIEMMIVDALVAADKANVFSFRGKDKKDYSLSGCIDDPAAFCLAQDDVLQQIRSSRSIEALGAREIIRRLDTRQLYRSVGEVSIRRPGYRLPNWAGRGDDEDSHPVSYSISPEEENPNTFTQIEERNTELYRLYDRSEAELKSMLLNTKAARLVDLSSSDVIVERMSVHHGSGARNPLEDVYFYSKSAPDRARLLSRAKYENLCPATFMKEAIRVFCTSTSPNVIASVHDAFRELTDTKPFLATNATPVHGISDDDDEEDSTA